MNHRTHLVFNDFVIGNASVTSADQLVELLGRHNRVGIHAVVDTVQGNTSFDLFIEQSANGVSDTWVVRNGGTVAVGNGDISIGAMTTAGQPYQKMFSASCTGTSAGGPLLPYIRFRVLMGGSGARVRVYATHRG